MTSCDPSGRRVKFLANCTRDPRIGGRQKATGDTYHAQLQGECDFEFGHVARPKMTHCANRVAEARGSPSSLRVGIDIVRIEHVRESLAHFGDRFIRRLFSPQEVHYAMKSIGLAAERLAARFAAKEATLKAFEMSNVGIDWREIEVVKLPSGACRLALHGRAAAVVAETEVSEIVLSLTHDGDYAAAVVTAMGVATASRTRAQSQ